MWVQRLIVELAKTIKQTRVLDVVLYTIKIQSELIRKYKNCNLNDYKITIMDYYSNPNNDGHIHVKIRNEGTKPLTVKQGDAFCQFIFMPFLLADGDDFDTGNERVGGFGSTTVTSD